MHLILTHSLTWSFSLSEEKVKLSQVNGVSSTHCSSDYYLPGLWIRPDIIRIRIWIRPSIKKNRIRPSKTTRIWILHNYDLKFKINLILFLFNINVNMIGTSFKVCPYSKNRKPPYSKNRIRPYSKNRIRICNPATNQQTSWNL